MVDRTLREFSALTTANIRTGPHIDVGDKAFELKPALINMVQASQFCGKAHKDASAQLQHFLEICSTFTIKDVPADAVLLRLFPFSLVGRGKAVVLHPQRQTHYLVTLLHCLPSQVLCYRQNQCLTGENYKFSATVQ